MNAVTAGHCSSMDMKSPISLNGEYRFYHIHGYEEPYFVK